MIEFAFRLICNKENIKIQGRMNNNFNRKHHSPLVSSNEVKSWNLPITSPIVALDSTDHCLLTLVLKSLIHSVSFVKLLTFVTYHQNNVSDIVCLM